jgi:hypothetical protein
MNYVCYLMSSLIAITPVLAQEALAQSGRASTLVSGFMVPKVPELRPTTAAESRAADIWNLRAALNVAALQCQFSPYLRTVSNYNEMLRHHSTELNGVMNTLKGHFRRYDGAKGVNSFDQYTTKTYNSFSTLDAQYSFCDAAAQAGREVLTLKRGELGSAARKHVDALRASLLPRDTLPFYDIAIPAPVQLAQIEPPSDKGNRRR